MLAGFVPPVQQEQAGVTGSYPEIVAAVAALAGGRDLIVDGELIVQGAGGAPSFGLLQRRMHVVNPSAVLVRSIPVQLYVFDILALDGTDRTGLPYRVRRELLAETVLDSPAVRVPPHWTGVAADRLIAVSAEHDLEGIVSKRLSSIYLPGRRSTAWIKSVRRKRTVALIAGAIFGEELHRMQDCAVGVP